MSKKAKLSSDCSAEVKGIDWSLCVLCQQPSLGHLIDPRNGRSLEKPKGYRTLADNLEELHSLNALPLNIDISRLDDGSGIEETLTTNFAKWHKSCLVLCSRSQVDRVRKRKEKEQSATITSSPVKSRLRSSFATPSMDDENQPMCFFCDQITDDHDRHRAATQNFDMQVRQMVNELGDTKLLAKMSVGDMTALDAVYHKKCYTALYTRHRSLTRKNQSKVYNEMKPESVAFAELVSYMEDCQQKNHPIGSIFKLSELVKLYTQRLKQLGADMSTRVHPTRLKERLLFQMPNLEANKSNYEVVLTFKEDVGNALLLASQNDDDGDAMVLMRAANIVRKGILQMNYHCNGSLDDDQYDILPQSLVALLQMILGGSNMQKQSENCNSIRGAVSSLTQLLVFNTMKRSRNGLGSRHNPDRETLLPLYLGLLIHGKTRKRELVDVLFNHGLSVSYDRILQLSTDIGNAVIDLFESDGLVFPTNFQHGLFTTGNLDNIDHDPTSTSAHTAFHGTAISLTQHCSEVNSSNVERSAAHRLSCKGQNSTKSKLKSLPETYTLVQPAAFPSANPLPSLIVAPMIPGDGIICQNDAHTTWLNKVSDQIQKEETDGKDNISWSAHFASLQEAVPCPPAITGLLPLFRDSAHSVSMVKHGMNLIQKATEHVNHDQVPVITVDQPLYAIAKKIQWTWPIKYGESKFVVMLGGLHIEMSFLRLIGDWLAGSGWAEAITAANVTTEGRVDALLKGSHIARGQWAHQVSAAALYALQKRAHAAYKEELTSEDTLEFDDWCNHMQVSHPQFNYWSKVMKLQLLFLQFLRSKREANFPLYIEALGKISPWMFAMDHIHYARWLTIHVIDLLQLQCRCPEIYEEFVGGRFVTQKTSHKFSCLAHDQIHEQQNAIVKGDAGIIGISENEAALKRWMVSGPEIGRMLTEYEVKSTKKRINSDLHHEQIPSTQKLFFSHTKSLVNAIEEMGNPFSDDSSDLVTLHTNVIMPEKVVNAIKTAEEIGTEQYQAFTEERLGGTSKSLYDTIRKNNLPLFKSGQKKGTRNSTKKTTMKSDVRLFSRMYISCQSREGELDFFFDHENHPWPPALADNNSLRQGNKSDLMRCLEGLAAHPVDTPLPDIKVIDGAALVHTLDPKRSGVVVKTFEDFSQHIFLPHIARQLQCVKRLDVVWDVYKAGSIKSYARECRGSGDALRVASSTKLPPNWKTFLRVDSNKTGLFNFLACKLKSFSVPNCKLLITTYEDRVLSSPQSDVSQLEPCIQDEADGRMLLHAAHAYKHGHKKILIQATDTDVVVLAIRTAAILHDCKIWVAFGHGKTFRYISAHGIAAALGSERSRGLLFLHAFSGCDTVSAFSGIGKKTAWEVWQSAEVFQTLFSKLSDSPRQITDAEMDTLERFVVLLYKRTSPLQKVNEARKRLFACGNRQIENIPPTRAALFQHAKRALFQAGHIWGQTLLANYEVPSPTDWGWLKEGDIWVPKWSTLPEASKACRELVKCTCKNNNCTGRCKCYKTNLPCTQLCSCGGQCA